MNEDGFWIEDDSHIDYGAMMKRNLLLDTKNDSYEWRKQRKKFLDEIQDNEKFCVICLKKEDITVDHIIPRNKGGLHDFTNLQLLCRSCNSKKADKL